MVKVDKHPSDNSVYVYGLMQPRQKFVVRMWCNTNKLVKAKKSMQVDHTTSGAQSYRDLPRDNETSAVCDEEQGDNGLRQRAIDAAQTSEV